MLLAIDTSTELAGIALYDGAVLGELTWVAGRRHSAELLPQIERLVGLCRVGTEALTAIGVARGPGSFTGVRVGLATAQGLALALGIPAYGISTLDVLAAGQEASAVPVRPLLDAGRRRYATALYEPRAGRLERVSEMVGIELGQLPELIRGPCLLVGELTAAARLRVGELVGEAAAVASPALSLRRPGVLAQLAWEAHRGSAPSAPASLEPLYLGRS